MIIDILRRLIKKSKLMVMVAQATCAWILGNDIFVLHKGLFDHTIAVTGAGDRFFLSKDLATVINAQEDYRFDGMRESDIVIDVGANIGGFCIPASRVSRHVYAIEPITVEELRKNIELNRRKVEVLEVALGNGDGAKVEWEASHRHMVTKTLADIKGSCGGCDFLKIDCEGYEWMIKLEELEGIRRIEMEVHKVRGLSPPANRLKSMEGLLQDAGFSCIVDKKESSMIGWARDVGIIHAWRTGSKPVVE